METYCEREIPKMKAIGEEENVYRGRSSTDGLIARSNNERREGELDERH